MGNSRFALVLVVAFFAVSSYASPLLKHNDRPLDAESTIEALEPWETPISGFFIRNHHEVPVVEAGRWQVRIDGLVEKPMTLSLADLKRLTKQSFHAVLECSGNGRGTISPKVPGIQWKHGAIGNAEWTGARLADVLAKAGPKANAKFLVIEGADKPALPTVPGFVRSIPLKKALESDTLLAWEMNREPIPALHGGPLRLILPRWYGQNWIKWVIRITLAAEEDSGFYQKKGYRYPKVPVKPGESWDSATGAPIETIRVQSFLVAPRPESTVPPGAVEVRGKAFSGSGTIERVEVSLDGAKQWQRAALDRSRASGSWQEFRHLFPSLMPGKYSVTVRATDSAGQTQPSQNEWNPSGYLANGTQTVTFRVGEAIGSGAELISAKCQMCHSLGLVYGQTLSREAWSKVIKKMESFGAQLDDKEHDRAVDFLAAEGSGFAPEPTDFAPQLERFHPKVQRGVRASRGEKLFKQNCAACHGPEGEGQIGPRLLGRAVPKEDFLRIAREGRNLMPAFPLKPADVEAIRLWVQRPVFTSQKK